MNNVHWTSMMATMILTMIATMMMTILIRREPWLSKRHFPQLQQGRGGEDFICITITTIISITIIITISVTSITITVTISNNMMIKINKEDNLQTLEIFSLPYEHNDHDHDQHYHHPHHRCRWPICLWNSTSRTTKTTHLRSSAFPTSTTNLMRRSLRLTCSLWGESISFWEVCKGFSTIVCFNTIFALFDIW